MPRRETQGGGMERATEIDQIPLVMRGFQGEKYEHEIGEDIVRELIEKQSMARKPGDGSLFCNL